MRRVATAARRAALRTLAPIARDRRHHRGRPARSTSTAQTMNLERASTRPSSPACSARPPGRSRPRSAPTIAGCSSVTAGAPDRCPSTSRSTTSRTTATTGRSRSRPAGRPAAAGAALPHAASCSYSLQRRAAGSTSSTGSRTRRQLPRAARLPREDRRASRIEVDLVAEMAVLNPFDFFLEPSRRDSSRSRTSPALRARARAVPAEAPRRRRGFAEFLARDRRAAARRRSTSSSRSTSGCSSDIGYLIRMEPGVQTPEETLATRSGSCRDTAWLLVQLLRHLGLAARFVSGYLIQLTRRREVARRPERAPSATSPTCTPGARSTCRAPAGSASIRPRACWPAKATSRSPARPSRVSAAPVTGALDDVRDGLRARR